MTHSTTKRLSPGFVLAIGIALAAAAQVALGGGWERIEAPAQATVVVNGQERDIAPQCIAAGETGDAGYAFYFKRGNPNKLVVFFNGGGACWNDATCVIGANPPALYVPTADTPFNHPDSWGGLLAEDDNGSPFHEWSMAFLPYCTGDIHIGSRTTQYQFGPFGATIAHHGADNFQFARDWLGRNVPGVKMLLVAGSSAGAYGAVLNYGHLRETYPAAQGYLVGDGGNGVVTEAFVQSALHDAWGGAGNLPPALLPLANFVSPTFLPAAYQLLASFYPQDRFAQYTTAWDGVQTLVYNVMLHEDAPQEWFTTIAGAVVPWHITMRTFAYASAVAAPNYRYFIAPGCMHTILRFDDAFQAGGPKKSSFMSWLSAQTTGQGQVPPSAWSNRDSCMLPGGCPPPSPQELIACAQQPG